MEKSYNKSGQAVFTAVIFALMLCFQESYSQPYFGHWVPVSSPVNVSLNASGLVSSQMCVAGAGGTVLKSSDGINWSVYHTGSPNDLYSVIEYQPDFVCGANGFIARTTNYGVNWINVSFPLSVNLNSITGAFGALYKLVCGDNGIIYLTTNNGINWTGIPSGTSNNLRCASYNGNLSMYRTYICGDNGTFRKLVYTTPPVPPVITVFQFGTGVTNHLYYVRALADTTVLMIAGSGGTILKSTNGGAQWFSQSSGTTKNLRHIYAVNQNDIWICGDQGTILHTTNGGAVWSAQTVSSAADLKTLVIHPNGRGFAFGSGGTILKCEFPPQTNDTAIKWALLNGNNIRTLFTSSGLFNKDIRTMNTPGFEWPKGSGIYAIFSSGLSMSALVNGQLRQAMCSYEGEFRQGRISGGVPQMHSELNRVWRVSASDNCYTSVDWANWGLVVPYGAPYKDVNNNGVYEPCTDIPGVINASQTVFMALTDGFASSHDPGEGFGGGTLPLNADMKITAWCYTDSVVADVQYIKFDVINRGSSAWNNLYFALTGDFDLGDANDDYLCMDSARNMWIGYNGDNNDPRYGLNPPAVGMRVLKFPVNKNVIPHDTIKTSAGVHFICTGCAPPPCESDPNGEPLGAYNMMKGYKKDMSRWMNPTFTPPRPVKFIYGGEPEPNTGWTELKGSIWNCGGDTGVYHPVNEPLDRRYVLSLGKDNFTMNPGDSVSILAAQLIARGTSNTNSVTKLKQLSDILLEYYNTGIVPVGTEVPEKYSLSQNYPNPFNPVTKISFQVPAQNPNFGSGSVQVTLKVYDILGREVAVLVNSRLQAGVYQVTFDARGLASGIYLYKMTAGIYSETKRAVLLK